MQGYPEEFAGDVRGMEADIREREKKGGRDCVSRPAKRIELALESVHADR